jgi:hypothetical protein
LASVVVVLPDAAPVVVVVVAPLDVDLVLTAVLVVAAGACPAFVLAVVGVTDAGLAAFVLVVVVGGGDAAGGGTSVEALQIWLYDGVTAGAGAVGLSGSFSWNIQPSTSSAGLETDCSAGPSSAYTHEPVDPCQYDQ